VEADLHLTCIVFGAVQDVDLIVADDGSWVEGMEDLPTNGGFGDGVREERGTVGCDDRGVVGACEGADLPTILSRFGCTQSEYEEGC
jgi:hypothetical protein